MRPGLRAQRSQARQGQNRNVEFIRFWRHQRQPGISGAGLKADALITREIPTNVNLRELQFSDPDRYPFLLQSTAIGSSLGRYDILLAFPGKSLAAGMAGDPGGFLESLDEWWQDERIGCSNSDLPFLGGWFVYLGYELAAEIEPKLSLPPDPVLPRAFAVRCPAALIRDHMESKTFIVCEGTATHCIDIMQEDARRIADDTQWHVPGPALIRAVGEEDPVRFTEAVDRAKQYIAAGDVFQANLSRGWSFEVGMSAADIYSRLAGSNPAPFAGCARWADRWIISSSPERLLSIRDGIASTRPIAGTRPRSAETSRDHSLSAELIANPKERAEHVMLIDLERNDLGRICMPGSIEVDEMMVIESYAHVHHIVSNVRGRLRAGITPGMAIRAVFPGGTITGCPKVRCMEIIAELEASPRGAYTGSFGYLNRDGSMDLNILIRTMVLHGSDLRLRAGAGIVADSEPQAELDETRAKARGLLEALT
ncbi:MAG TPA: aminodeoxychorismate synthase component I [Woeseiaceae bacterium]|nr:aminodeoxychorismate synthase component I [Woeseiaceae bacterium]